MYRRYVCHTQNKLLIPQKKKNHNITQSTRLGMNPVQGSVDSKFGIFRFTHTYFYFVGLFCKVQSSTVRFGLRFGFYLGRLGYSKYNFIGQNVDETRFGRFKDWFSEGSRSLRSLSIFRFVPSLQSVNEPTKRGFD